MKHAAAHRTGAACAAWAQTLSAPDGGLQVLRLARGGRQLCSWWRRAWLFSSALVLFSAWSPALAQRGHTSYVVDIGSVKASGNYSYNAGSYGGDVDAVAPSPRGGSSIQVTFLVTYFAPGGTPGLSLSATGHLYGSASGMSSSANSGFSAENGQYGTGATAPNSYDRQYSLLPLPPIYAPGATLAIPGIANASSYPGGSAYGHAAVWFE